MGLFCWLVDSSLPTREPQSVFTYPAELMGRYEGRSQCRGMKPHYNSEICSFAIVSDWPIQDDKFGHHYYYAYLPTLSTYQGLKRDFLDTGSILECMRHIFLGHIQILCLSTGMWLGVLLWLLFVATTLCEKVCFRCFRRNILTCLCAARCVQLGKVFPLHYSIDHR